MNTIVQTVSARTAKYGSERIQAQTETSIDYYSQHPEEIDQRLAELDSEWDVERAIQTEAATTILSGVILGATVNRKWFLLPAFASSMLLLHNLHGFYPLLPLFRRMGFRTREEIEEERRALECIQGELEIREAVESTIAANLPATGME